MQVSPYQILAMQSLLLIQLLSQILLCSVVICKSQVYYYYFYYSYLIPFISSKATPGSALWYVFIGKEGVKSTADLSKTPLLIWLNGGPGASSTDGLFFENGPFVLTVLPDGSIIETKRKVSWTSNYSVLFID